MKILTILLSLLMTLNASAAAQSSESMSAADEALVHSALDRQLAKVQDLVEKGADVDAVGGKDRTALMWAAANGHTEVVEYLYSKGADINAKDGDNQTALMLATRRSYVPIVEFLLQNGAEVNVQSRKQQISALMIAAAVGNETIVRMLLDHGADRSLVGMGGHTALDRARQFEHPAVVILLEDASGAEG
jgi:ankyrin repeat protein